MAETVSVTQSCRFIISIITRFEDEVCVEDNIIIIITHKPRTLYHPEQLLFYYNDHHQSAYYTYVSSNKMDMKYCLQLLKFPKLGLKS